MKEEVFVVLAKSGSLTIEKEVNNNLEIFHFIYCDWQNDHSKKIIKTQTFKSFEDAFQFINKNYPWFELWVETVSREYRQYIFEELKKALQSQSVNLEQIKHSLFILQSTLKMDLNLNLKNTSQDDFEILNGLNFKRSSVFHSI